MRRRGGIELNPNQGAKNGDPIIKFLDRMETAGTALLFLSCSRPDGLGSRSIRETDLANHLLKEPIPKKIDDFRHHPLYVFGTTFTTK